MTGGEKKQRLYTQITEERRGEAVTSWQPRARSRARSCKPLIPSARAKGSLREQHLGPFCPLLPGAPQNRSQVRREAWWAPPCGLPRQGARDRALPAGCLRPRRLGCSLGFALPLPMQTPRPQQPPHHSWTLRSRLLAPAPHHPVDAEDWEAGLCRPRAGPFSQTRE